MSTYYIGDLQGCFDELQDLLQLIHFDPTQDQLGFVGDLVNRGPKSLAVLRFLKSTPNVKVVLGNHDIFCLILGYGLIPTDAYKHTLHEVLTAPDKLELLEWLRQQPLLSIDDEQQAVMVHAGIAPQWNIHQAKQFADEVQQQLRGENFKAYLQHVFGNEPPQWHEKLTGLPRWRYITNSLVRMRLCRADGTLEFNTLEATSFDGYQPWFDFRTYQQDQHQIYFGHWAKLNGHCATAHCHALDTGCAWGHELTAIRLEDQQRFSVSKRKSF